MKENATFMEKVKYFFLSLVTDTDWDADAAKVAGWILIAIAIIGHFLGLPENDKFLYAGIGAITLKGTGEALHG